MLIMLAAPLAFAMCLSGFVRAEEESAFAPKNGIPLVVVRVDEQELHQDGDNWYGSIDDMNSSKDHSVRCKGTVEIIVPDGYQSEFGGNAPSGALKLDYIRGRGNSTWDPDPGRKKPYKIKFDKKQALFGMDEAKEWALMANANDRTLMKNHITSWLGIAMGHEESPRMIPVDVVMTDSTENPAKTQYLGSYCLSELVDLKGIRSDLHDPKSSGATEGIDTWYLLTIYNDYQNADEPESTVFRTDGGIDLINKDPSYDDTDGALTDEEEQQRAYIRKYVQDIEDIIMKTDQIDEEAHERLASMVDLESVADYWLVQEFCGNGDAFVTSSTYMYKKRDGKLCMGPLWDFDIAWGTIWETEDISDHEDIKGLNGTQMPWLFELRDKDPLFGEILEQRWEVMNQKLAEMTQTNGVIDGYASELALSQAENARLWPDSQEWDDGDDQDDTAPPEVHGYQDEVTGLKRWIDARRNWINEHREQLGKVYCDVSFAADDQVIKTVRVMYGGQTQQQLAPVAPEKDGYVFSQWVEEESGEPFESYTIDRDIRVVPEYVREEDAVVPEHLVFSEQEDWTSLQSQSVILKTCGIYPQDTTNQTVVWTVDDESVASIDDENRLVLHKTGKTTITATLYNGVSGSYVLHVYDEEETSKVSTEAVRPDVTEVTMKRDDFKQITYSLEPENKPVESTYVAFSSSDEDIVEIDEYGVLTAKKPGTAVITLEIPVYDDEEEAITAQVSVTVEPNVYTITYDLNGGTLDGKTGKITEEYEEGSEVTVKAAPVRDGYTFQYWEGSRYNPGDTFMATEDHTLKAVWKESSSGGSDGSGQSYSGASADSTKTGASGTTARAADTGNTAKTGTASKNAQSAKTGDTDLLTRWFVLMLISGVVLTASVMSFRKRKA